MFRPTIALMFAVAALVLIATGCGGSSYGSDDAKSAAPGAAAPAKPASGAPALAAPAPAPASKPAEAASTAKAIEVDVKDNLFEPATIHAKVGQKITWNLSGQISHTVTASENAKFDSGPLGPGQSFSYTTKKAGTIRYLCSFHQGMTGTIVVE
jgi:plastocyanin